MVPGGLSQSKPSDEMVHKLVMDLKPQIEEKLGKSLDTLTAINYKTQVVAGVNYFIKVKTGDVEYAHLRIYKHFSGETSLHGVQSSKNEQDDILYF